MRVGRPVLTFSVALVLLGTLPVGRAQEQSSSIVSRLAARREIEKVYWRHRSWPPSNPGPKPALDDVLPQHVIRARVEDYLKKSLALERFWGLRVTGGDLQQEIVRMASQSRSPEVLRELFAALGDDPARIAEDLARPLLVDRLIRARYAGDKSLHATPRSGAGPPAGAGRDGDFESWWTETSRSLPLHLEATSYSYWLPEAVAPSCAEDTWREIRTDEPIGRAGQTAVWTGSEMIVWGGQIHSSVPFAFLGTGDRYDPATDSWTAVRADAGAPEGRTFHTAVWTGTEMIVWGGESRTTYLNTGGRYDPVSDTWRSMRVDPQVVPAIDHTAVWTGNEMIVWGGAFGAFVSSRYDPSTDTWRGLSTLDAPVSRYSHSALWTGTEMIIWGGQENFTYVNTGGRYNPAQDQWFPTKADPTTPAARAGHTAVWTGGEMIVFGGYINSLIFGDGGRYDPATDSWVLVPGIPDPPGRIGHTAVWTETEMIVWGTAESGSGMTGGRYDPAANAWTATRLDATTPSARRDFTAVWSGTEMIVWGGYSPTSGFLNSGGRYDPADDTWTATGLIYAAPSGRQLHTAVWTGSEMVVWGGSGGGASLNAGSRYDPATDSWTPVRLDANTPTARSRHTAVWTGVEMIVWGGENAEPGPAGTGGRYNPTTDTWQATRADSTTPDMRWNHTAVWTGSDMIVWGGTNSLGVPYLSTGGRYDPSTDSWEATAVNTVLAAGRHLHSAVWTGHEMVIWGGYNPTSGYLNSGGRYDPLADSWRAVRSDATAPARRHLHTTVWTGREMIVWGGRDPTSLPSSLKSGGRYDPVADTWIRTRLDLTTPDSRYSHGAAWTGREMIVWGGQVETSQLRTGGRYDPATDTWRPTRSDDTAPNDRRGPTAVWTGNQMLVWGGDGVNTGGAYCACPGAVAVYYQDSDGDGLGQSGVEVPSCVQPSGFVPSGGDCNDADPESWGVPGEALDLLFTDQESLGWSAPQDAGGTAGLTYDLLRSASSDFEAAATCVASGLPEAAAADPATPPPGISWNYLVRARNACPRGTGPLGFDSQGGPRPGRDCP